MYNLVDVLTFTKSYVPRVCTLVLFIKKILLQTKLLIVSYQCLHVLEGMVVRTLFFYTLEHPVLSFNFKSVYFLWFNCANLVKTKQYINYLKFIHVVVLLLVELNSCSITRHETWCLDKLQSELGTLPQTIISNPLLSKCCYYHC